MKDLQYAYLNPFSKQIPMTVTRGIPLEPILTTEVTGYTDFMISIEALVDWAK